MASGTSGNVAARIQAQSLRMAQEVSQAGRSAVAAALLEVKGSVERERKRVTSTGRLRNVGSSGARLGVRFDVKGKRNPTGMIRATGPWQLVEFDTQRHFIVAKGLGFKSTRASRGERARSAGSAATFGGQARGVFGGFDRKGKKALTIGGLPRAYAAHPGTRGREPFKKGVEAGTQKAIDVVNKAHTTAILKGFRS